MVLVAGVGLVQMRQIGAELEEIADETVPLTTNVSTLTLHQLEQALLLERLLRIARIEPTGENQSGAPIALALTKLGDQVDEEILVAEAIAEKGLSLAVSEAHRAKYGEILARLKRIEADHKVYNGHVETVIARI